MAGVTSNLLWLLLLWYPLLFSVSRTVYCCHMLYAFQSVISVFPLFSLSSFSAITCWLGHLTCKIVSKMTYNVLSGTLNPTILYHTTMKQLRCLQWLWPSMEGYFVSIYFWEPTCDLYIILFFPVCWLAPFVWFPMSLLKYFWLICLLTQNGI